jgi:putative glycerol-1-phosphate prenyltransferase
MDAGSGAQTCISSEMIRKVSGAINVPLVVGGGMRTIEDVRNCFESGADIAVVGNALESNPDLLEELAELLRH